MPYGVVTFDRNASDKLGIHVEFLPGYETPERDYDIQHIPGRNGDVVIDKGSYKNVSRRYSISAADHVKNFLELTQNIVQWLHSGSGYRVLEDSYEPDYYRMAMYHDSNEFPNAFNHGTRATIEFDCKPQRFLKSGSNKVTVSNQGTIQNPTNYIALPKIFVSGSGKGTLDVNDCHIVINKITNGMVLDSELRDAYSADASANLNGAIELDARRNFPKLKPGRNSIRYSGGINKIEVIPRWWTL